MARKYRGVQMERAWYCVGLYEWVRIGDYIGAPI